MASRRDLLSHPAAAACIRVGLRGVCRAVLWILRIKVTTTGTLPSGPALLVANHLSWIDIVAMVARYDCTFVAKDDVRNWPLVGVLGDALGVIWIDRRRKRDLIRAVDVLGDSLRRGTRVMLFPEGTTTNGRDVLPFRSSLLQSAVTAGVPVVPIAVSAYAADDQGETLCWFGDDTLAAHLPRVLALRDATFAMRVLEPIAPGPTRKEKSARARSRIIGARLADARSADARQPVVGKGVRGFAKQNFRPIESSEREMAR